jgi:hypothetical protein
MKTRTRSLPNVLLQLLIAAALVCGSAAALAMPKAAEHEDAPVTSGANAARPKHSSTAAVKPPAAGKAKPAGKAAKPGKSTRAAKKPKTSQTRK